MNLFVKLGKMITNKYLTVKLDLLVMLAVKCQDFINRFQIHKQTIIFKTAQI